MNEVDGHTLGTLLGRIGASISSFTHRWIWLILLAFLILVIILLIQPFGSSADTTAENIAAAWDEGIARLGISPLYPPAEDFYVGDVWAVIADVETPGTNSSNPQPAALQATSLIGKSVRIGYVDLREAMQTANDGQPLFPDTTDYKTDDKFHQESLLEIDKPPPSQKIALSLAAFPGVTITHKINATVSAGWGLGSLGLGRQNQQLEQIRIPIAETYGAPVGAAFIRLDEWCADPKTRIFCTDAYARHILAYAVSKHVLDQSDGKYNLQIALQFIYRVFMTREIDHTQLVSGDVAANLQFNAKQAEQSAATTDEKSAKADESGQKTLPQLLDATKPTSSSALTLGNSTQIGLHEVFQRPLVFGYRAITVDLTPASTGNAPSPPPHP